jgi:acetyl-CoA acetyltransferase
MTSGLIMMASFTRTPMSISKTPYRAPPPMTSAPVVKGAVRRALVGPAVIDRIHTRGALPGGLGQAPARQTGPRGSRARIIETSIAPVEARGSTGGFAALCIAGGKAAAVMIEQV